MKNINLNTVLAISLFSISAYATDYDNASFDNFVEGQGVNEVLQDAQFIICSLSRMGTESLSGDGTYIATIYSDECEAAGAAAGDSSQGTTAPTSAASSSSSSTSGESAATLTAKEIDTIIVNTGFTTQTTQTTKAWIVNDKIWDERSNREPKSITYLLNKQTAPASDASKFGNFTLRYQSGTFGNTQEELPEWYECPPETSRDYAYSWCSDGVDLGRGILIANGNSIKFKDEGTDGQQNVAADFYENGDIAGVYSKRTGFQDDSLRNPDCDGIEGDWWECQSPEYRESNTEILGIFAFGIVANTKSYCTKMTALYEVDWSQYNEETDGPTLTDYILTGEPLERLGKEGWDVSEKCFSIAKADAIKNIWDYGVFNTDGSTFTQTNGSFPIKSSVTVNDIEKNVHGYASYWGVHVEDEYQEYVDDSTSWKREDDNAEIPSIYNVIPRKLVVEKREKKYLALNELDGLNLNFWTNDSHWSEEFQQLGFAKVEPWEGKIQFKTNKAVFTDYNNGNSSDPLVYNLYGAHDGEDAFVVNLDGAKLDKDNIRKIIRNNSSDPGKPMNLTMEFSEFPDYKDYAGGGQETYVGIILCNGSSISYTRRTPYDAGDIDIKSDQQCMSVSGALQISSDGETMTLSSDPDREYGALFIDGSTGTRLYFDQANWNQGGNVYDFVIEKTGINRPAGMEIKLQSLFAAFGSLSQGDNDGGNISGGLESFLDSSDSFTFNVTRYEDIYDHNGDGFNNITGTFNVSDTPPAVVFIDDVFVAETNTDVSSDFFVYLSKAQESDVTFNYEISSSGTTSSDDYEGIFSSTVVIPAGLTSSTIPFIVNGDSLAEGITDETLILTISNVSSNVVLGRSTSPTAYIYDDDTNRVVYEDYIGSYNAQTETFTVTDGLLFSPSYSKTQLPAPITFTATQYEAVMKKVYNQGTDWEDVDFRDLRVYSQDTNSSYVISQNSLLNPSSNSSVNGITNETNTIVSPSELPSKLNCIQECLTASLVQSHYTNVKNQADPSADFSYSGSVSIPSPSPYVDVGPYIKTTQSITTIYNEGTADQYSEVRDYTRGDWNDGIIADDVYVYTKSDNKLLDSDGNEISIGVNWGTARPYEYIQGAGFTSVQGGWLRETTWGLNSGTLVDDVNLAKLECDYSVDENNIKTYNDSHPEYTSANGKISQIRYCANKIWSNSEINVSYNIRLETYKQYEIFNSDGSALTFNPPKILYFTAPNDQELFGDDAGKKFRLEMHGDSLGGIPGSVIDIDTGADLGEYVEEWRDNYRWVQRFQIPDGSVLTDNTSDDTYLVKALAGQEWLAKKDSAIGSMDTLLTSRGYVDLLGNRDLNFEIMNQEVSYYQCSLTRTVSDGDGNNYEETDWEACYEIDYDDPSYNEIWTLDVSFKNCQERIDWEIDRVAAEIERIKNDFAAREEVYFGPQTWDQLTIDNEWEWYPYAEYINTEQERCMTIGILPTSFINGGNASVVNGTVVFDPTP